MFCDAASLDVGRASDHIEGRSTVSGFVGDALTWVVGLVETLGYSGLAIVVALENVFPPIPSEAVLPLAGYLVSQGRMTLWGAVLASTVGSVVGALMLYWLGYAWGEKRVRWLVQAYGRWLMIDEDDLDRAQEWFEEHGRTAVFVARLAPLTRSVISIPAGVAKMPMGPFLLYTTLGSAIWNAVLIGAGWLLGANWGLVEKYQSLLGTAVVVLLVAVVVWFIGRRLLAGGKGQRRSPAAARE
jgi:membrane protein DedA with SNARE-associated domain